MQSEILSFLSTFLSFSYTCFDRCVIRGYLLELFGVGSVVNYFKQRGINNLTKETLSIPTTELVRHIENFAQQHEVPI